MTFNQLVYKFNTDYGLNEWPKTYEVDAETYANCCNQIFDLADAFQELDDHVAKLVWLGPHRRLMVKGVELLINEQHNTTK